MIIMEMIEDALQHWWVRWPLIAFFHALPSCLFLRLFLGSKDPLLKIEATIRRKGS